MVADEVFSVDELAKAIAATELAKLEILGVLKCAEARADVPADLEFQVWINDLFAASTRLVDASQIALQASRKMRAFLKVRG